MVADSEQRGTMNRPIVTVALFCLCASASAAQWLTPDFAPGAEPTFKPVPLYWLAVAETPYVYRTELLVPELANRATVALRSAGYVYVYVDGKQVFAAAPRSADQRGGARAEPADRNRVHLVDLSHALTQGKHVLTVSAPRDGFVLDGGIYLRTRRLASIASDAKWTVTKFAPTTILEDEPALRLAYTGPAAPVKTGEDWKAAEDDLAKAFFAAFLDRSRRTLDDIAWQAELMATKGIYIVDDSAHAWGGPQRLHPRAIITARLAPIACAKVRYELDKLASAGCSGTDELAKQFQAIAELKSKVREIEYEMSQTSNVALLTDETLLSMLYMKDAGLWNENMKDGGTLLTRAEIEKRVGHALPRLNESRYDRLGWIDHPGLSDSDMDRWRIRVNPLSGPTTRRAAKTWLFSTDPKDQGEKELRHSIGYNIENQMARVDATRSWTADSRFASYRGAAWYRGRIDIPGEWTGNGITMAVPIAGTARFWLNDNELDPARIEGDRTIYQLPEKAISFGGENFLAFRIKADGDRRGLTGTLELSCAAPDSGADRSALVDMLATPLSPCVVLTPRGDTLRIHHPAELKLVIPAPKGFAIAANSTEKLIANWAMLWTSPESEIADLYPVLLVFEHQPVSLVSKDGTTIIRFASKESRVIAVRPWANAPPPYEKPESITKTIDLWRRAALAVPINYLCLILL